MALFENLLRRIGVLPPETRFKPGDHVQRTDGSDLMIVESVKTCKNSKTSQLSCTWFDSQSKKDRTDIFTEDQLKLFDWYRAQSE